MPPYTTKRRATTKLKTKTNQNCLKIELYGSLITKVKEETFIQTGRRSRDKKPGWRKLIASWWLEDWAVPHLPADKPGGTTGERERPGNPDSQCRGEKPQKL